MTKTTSTTRRAFAFLAIVLALAVALLPTLVFATGADEVFDAPVTDIPVDVDDLEATSDAEDSVGASSSSPAGEAGTPQPGEPPSAEGGEPASELEPEPTSDPAPEPEPASYSLRLIVSADGTVLRDGDAVLGSHDGVYLLGFADETALADAEAYYAEMAEWAQRDIPMGAADDESPEGAPAPVDETTNALTLLDESVGASSSSPAGEAGTSQPELTPAAEGGHPLVALIDTGAPDDPAIVGSATFVGDDPADSNGHATAMLEAMKSEDPDVRVLAIKALDDDGRGSASSVYAAIEYATEQGAQIINLSLAGYASDENAAIAEAVGRALTNGIAVIAAAGNGGYDAAYFTPANIEGVFTVGACDEDGNVLESSNRGDCVDGYVVAGSTSAAVAHVSGWLSNSGLPAEWQIAIRKDFVKSYSGLLDGDAPDASTNIEIAATYRGIRIQIKPGNGQTWSLTKQWFAGGRDGSYGQYVHEDPANTTSTTEQHWNLDQYNGGLERLYGNLALRNPIQRFETRGTVGAGGVSEMFVGINTQIDGQGTWLIENNAEGRASGTTLSCNEDFLKGRFFSSAATVYVFWGYYDIQVRLDNEGADTGDEGSPYVYVRYSNGIYSDPGYSQLMTTSGPPITIPKKTGYVFKGYYLSENYKNNEQYIDANGYITSKFKNTSFKTHNATLYAYWVEQPTIILPVTGGIGENTAFLWGSMAAVVTAAGFVLFRALRPARRPVAVASRIRKPTPRRRTPAHARAK